MTGPYYAADGVTLHLGDSLDVLPTLADASVDAIVCDPPYEISFMNRAWDSSGIAYNVDLWRQCLRVLKPGGHLLAFGGTRTYHRMAVAIEDAGFEIRDSLHWIYGSGFPKGQSQLKPAHEPIVMARKPPVGSLIAAIAAHGTGALNIDGCRVAAGQDYRDKCASVVGLSSNRNGDAYGEWTGTREDSAHVVGRWPTNIVLTHPPLLDEDGQPVGDACADGCVDGCVVAEMDAQSGVLRARGNRAPTIAQKGTTGVYGTYSGAMLDHGPGDTGGASRFFPIFRYQAKAPASERPRLADGTAWPTVKPLALMRWLIRLVTPPGGTVLDWCAGTGTTLEAARLEGFPVIGVERDRDAADLCRIRLAEPYSVALFGDIA